MENVCDEINWCAAVAFGTESAVTMTTTAEEIVRCYLIGMAWGRLPPLPARWIDRISRDLKLESHDEQGELRQSFTEHDLIGKPSGHLSWFCGIEANDGNCVCESCGSEFFFVFRDANSITARIDRLVVLESMVRLSELGHIPPVHDQLIHAWQHFYDYIRLPEQTMRQRSGRAHGCV